ncbi:putative small heat shock protein HSP20 [Helianthus annuus]|nr:putative small heat shock protein HSP20 [Helianthus annuus]KAJ0756015.1 putative small heat shock protein HSP20 [Helianthus annuus]KAJ0794569.1 putative small heat shock protein HSP20 [Helianthus annuus]
MGVRFHPNYICLAAPLVIILKGIALWEWEWEWNAIVEAATNMNKLLENLSPSRLIRRFKEKDESYTIKFQMPGLSKDDVKITVEDGMMFIRGEHKDEEEGSDDDEFWSAATYGYYNTSLMLPEDAKVEEIKAEMKDGVLHVLIPKDETKKKQIKEVHVG